MLRVAARFVVGAAVGAVAAWTVFGNRVNDLGSGTITATTARAEPRTSVAPESGSQAIAGFPGDEALAALAQIERPADRRSAALATLDALGRDEQGIRRIAEALSAADRWNFTFDAIAAVAASDPVRAIDLALALDDFPARSEALRRIATTLGNADPRAALLHVSAIENYELADVFRAAVLEAWAGNDPDGFLAYMEAATVPETRAAAAAFAVAAALEPEGVLSMMGRLPEGRARSEAERAALEVLILTDTTRALAYLASLPPGEATNALHFVIAQTYARRDLDAALGWADTLGPTSNSARTGVLWALVKADPVRGADVFVDRLESARGPNAEFSPHRVLEAFTPAPRELLVRVVERFGRSESEVVRALYENLLFSWTQYDPEAFYEWALAAPDRLKGREHLARSLAELRPELAKLAVERLPADLQDAWIPSVASGLAVVSMDDALQWLSRYQGRPVYGQAVSAALGWASMMAGWENPPALASFLDTQSVELRADSIAVVANAWAQQDPAAAAVWVERVELSDATEDRRLPAIANVARRWAERNAEAAEDWALGLPAGAARDEALGTVLSVTSEAGRVETRLLRAFSSDLIAQQQVASIMGNLGRNDPDLGRELIGRYITDPALRAQAEQRLVRGVSGESSSTRGVLSVR